MKIVKHGKVISFLCPYCGCEWNVTRDEVDKENDPSASTDGAIHIQFFMDCPECGGGCAKEYNRAEWD
jgi:hypothetical protein